MCTQPENTLGYDLLGAQQSQVFLLLGPPSFPSQQARSVLDLSLASFDVDVTCTLESNFDS